LNDNFEALKAAFTNTVSRDGSTPNSMSADLDLNSNDVKNVKTIDADSFILNGTLMTPSGVDPVYSGTISAFGASLIDDADAATARTTLGLNTLATQDISYVNTNVEIGDANWTGADLEVVNGGTGASSASSARSNLGLGTAAVVDILDEDDMVSNSATDVPSQQSVKAYVDNSASGVGIDQTWQDVLSSRSSGTVYQNTTGNPIMVFASQNSVGGTSNISAEVSADNVTFIEVSYGSGRYGADGVSFIVPNNHYYKVTASLRKWAELR
jgi:hypothetical protein